MPIQSRVSKLRGWLLSHRADVMCCVLLALLTIFVQYRSGAYHSDLSLDADEPAHAVSSLMVRDYLTRWPSPPPFAFALDFYNHYPKVAIGHWPPLFYAAEALWTLAFGRSRQALLSFIAFCGVLLVMSVYAQLQSRVGASLALLGALMLLFSKPFEQMIASVRPDLLLALLVFWAAIAAARYMITNARQELLHFSLLTLAAFLTHGRAAVLLLVPFLLLPFTKRRISWLWVTAGVCVLALFLLPPFLEQAYRLSWDTLLMDARNAITYGLTLPRVLLLPFLLIGVVFSLRTVERSTFLAGMSALFLAGFVFTQLVPVGWEEYRLITMIPAAAVLIATGLRVCLDRGKSRLGPQSGWPGAVLATVAMGWLVWNLDHPFVKPDLGYHRLVAEGLLRGHSVALVAADPRNEGALIAEGALDDPATFRTILRSSKSLATMNWNGDFFKEKALSSQQMQQFLYDRNISLVVLELNVPRRSEIVHLRAVLDGNAAWTYSKTGDLEMYRRKDRPAHTPPGTIDTP